MRAATSHYNVHPRRPAQPARSRDSSPSSGSRSSPESPTRSLHGRQAVVREEVARPVDGDLPEVEDVKPRRIDRVDDGAEGVGQDEDLVLRVWQPAPDPEGSLCISPAGTVDYIKINEGRARRKSGGQPPNVGGCTLSDLDWTEFIRIDLGSVTKMVMAIVTLRVLSISPGPDPGCARNSD